MKTTDILCIQDMEDENRWNNGALITVGICSEKDTIHTRVVYHIHSQLSLPGPQLTWALITAKMQHGRRASSSGPGAI